MHPGDGQRRRVEPRPAAGGHPERQRDQQAQPHRRRRVRITCSSSELRIRSVLRLIQSHQSQRSTLLASIGPRVTGDDPGSVTRRDPPRARDQALRRGQVAVDDLTLEVAEGELCVLVGPVGLRQDHHDAHDQPAHRADRRPHLPRRRGHPAARPRAPAPPHRLRHPADRPVPAHDDRRQRGHRAAAARLEGRPRPAAGRRAARAGRARPDSLPRPLPAPALRRAAPARRRGPGPRRRSRRAAHGRAVRRHRPDHPGAPAGRVPPPAGRGAQDDRVRHPRHRGGGEARRPHRHPPPGRGPGPVRHARGDPRLAGIGVRGRLRRRRPGPQAPEGHRHRPRRSPAAAGPRRRPTAGRGPHAACATRTWTSRWCSTASSACAATWPRPGPTARASSATGSSGSRPGFAPTTPSRTPSARCCCYDAGWVAVLDDEDRFLGVLTPESIYEASRRSTDDSER